MYKRNLALLAATIVSIIYGVTFTIAKDVMPQYIDAFGFIAIRVGGTMALFWMVSIAINAFKKSPAEKIDPSDYKRIIAQHAYFFQRIKFDIANKRRSNNGVYSNDRYGAFGNFG